MRLSHFLPLLAVALFAGPGAAIEIDDVSGEEESETTTPTTTTTTRQPESKSPKFSCVVCDSLTSSTCDNWDGVSHVTPCVKDTWVNSSRRMGCRKIVQYVDGDRFVSRHCTNLVAKYAQGCIDRVGTHKIKMRYCHCLGERCNSAQLPTASAATLLLPSLLLLLLAAAA